jgi:hypothetical protein
VGYSSHFIRTEQFQEGGGDNFDLQELVAFQISNDIGEVNSTYEGHRQHGIETKNQNPKSLTISQRSTSSRMKSTTSGMDTRKTSFGGLDDGGYKNPPRKILEKTHITYTPVKRKTNISSVEINALEFQESHHAMDMDDLIEEHV